MPIDPDGPANKARLSILNQVTAADLKWTKVPLKYDPDRPIGEAPFSIEVSQVVSKNGTFVPVTADETFALAKKWKVFPLTGAVMDQLVHSARFVNRKIMDPDKEILNYRKYSDFLSKTAYGLFLAVGAHKLWTISGKGQRINHGFHTKTRIHQSPPKFLGKGWDAIQVAGPAHEHETHSWDYSQLLQVMRKFRNERDGIDLDIRGALRSKHSALWDLKSEDGKGPARLP